MAAMLAASVSAPGRTQELPDLPVSLDLRTSPLLTGGGLTGQINLDLETSLPTDILSGRILDIDLTVPDGFVLRDVSCPAGVSVSVNGTASSVGSGIGLADCVLSLVNVAAVSNVALPVIQQRNDFLLSVELGLSQQLDRFGDTGLQEGELPKPSGLGMSSATAAFGDGRMGLGQQDTASPAPLAFSTSLQQLQRNSQRQYQTAPNMLGAAVRRPAPQVSRNFNIWTEGYLAHTEAGSGAAESDGHTAVIYAGADYLLSPHLLIGALIQYDDQEQSFDGAPIEFSEHGWLAGPYAVLRLSETVFFQTRAAWGQSENDMRFDGVFDDSFDSDRWLVKGRLLANLRAGNWLVRPSASIAYIEDQLEAYRSSSGVDVAGRTLSLGQLKFGPEVAYTFASSGGFSITPSINIEGIWNFEQDTGAAGFDDLAVADGLRGRIEAGATILNAQGASLGFAASYDGIGSSDFSAIGGRARLNVPLH